LERGAEAGDREGGVRAAGGSAQRGAAGIHAGVLTVSELHDSEPVPQLLGEIRTPLGQVYGDGAYAILVRALNHMADIGMW
jgi:hypothetical protein